MSRGPTAGSASVGVFTADGGGGAAGTRPPLSSIESPKPAARLAAEASAIDPQLANLKTEDPATRNPSVLFVHASTSREHEAQTARCRAMPAGPVAPRPPAYCLRADSEGCGSNRTSPPSR